MATYWVKTLGGSDASDGSTFALAKATLPAALALLSSAGDILNIVADGDHAWPTTETAKSSGSGASWASPGFTIRGVTDATEAPAIASIVASGGDSVRNFVQMNAGSGYIIFRNLEFDALGKEADANAYRILRINNPTGPYWFDGCSFLARNIGSTTSPGTRAPITLQGGGADENRVFYSYFQGMNSAVGLAGATLSAYFRYCLFLDDYNQGTNTLITRTLASGTGDEFELTNCTFYRSVAGNASTTLISYATAGTDAGLNNIHSNLVFIESSSGTAHVEFLTDSSGPISFTGTVGYNVLLGGPNVALGNLNADGWYVGTTFDVGPDPKATDQAAYSQAEAAIFSAVGSTFAWDALSNGATITIAKDLRPLTYLTASLAGGVVGALPAAETDYGVAIVTNNTAPLPDDTVILTVTATNDGTAATGVTMTCPLPAGLTLVSSTPSAGSYDSVTGIWTIGAMADAASETLAITATVDSDQSGNTLTVTATTTSGDPSTDPNSANDSASVSMTVYVDIDTDPIETLYLDVAPIYAPVLLAEINAIIRTKRNRLTQHEQRFDLERQRFREYTSRRLTLAASTTISVISSIERADHLLVEATGEIEVSTSNSATDAYMPAATIVSVLNGDFTTLKIRNPSSTASVDLLLVVID